jgi:hypothetical protein
MSDLLARFQPIAPRRQALPAAHVREGRLEHFGPGHPGRADIEAFIADAFLKTYGARISHFCDTLIGCRDDAGAWTAALGYSLARDAPLFLEHYLDTMLEVEIGKRLGHAVARTQIVEVGNLAAIHAGAARGLIVRTTDLLYHMGLHLVAFTATASLLNSFGRLHLRPRLLGPADPGRLPGGGGQWGSYYDTRPQVMFGDIRYGHEKLARLFARQQRPA